MMPWSKLATLVSLLGICSLATADLFIPNTVIERRVRIAGEIIINRMASTAPIPRYIIEKAHCVAAIKISKYGQTTLESESTGLVSCKVGTRWSVPSFFDTPQLNFTSNEKVQSLESILLFMTDYSQHVLSRYSFRLGTDLSTHIGPVEGMERERILPSSHVIVYAEKNGQTEIGKALKGLTLVRGIGYNRRVYGIGVLPEHLLSTPGELSPDIMRPFVDVLTTDLDPYPPNK